MQSLCGSLCAGDTVSKLKWGKILLGILMQLLTNS